jgi:hypothetical protein
MQTYLDTPARSRPEPPSLRAVGVGGRSPVRLAFGARYRLALGARCGLAFGCLWALALGEGCEEYGPRVYTAAPYRVARGCLDAYAPLGLVQARDLGAQCAAVCLREGGTLYVSSVCPPYPAEATLEAADAGNECGVALAAPSCDSDAAAP